MLQERSMTCKDILNGEVHSVGQDESLMQASAVMRDAEVGFLPVCDGCGTVVGTLTDRDIVVRAAASGVPMDAAVAEFMTRGPITCKASDGLEQVVATLRMERLSRLVCLEDGRVAGVVSLDDLKREQLLPREVAAVEQALADLRS